MLRSITLLVTLLALPAMAETQYLCIEEAAGGVAHQNGRWSGTSFRTEDKYLVKFATQDGEVATYSGIPKYAIYRIGQKNYDLLCDGTTETRIFCRAWHGEFKINLSNLRFIRTETIGFWEDGEGRRSGTPHLGIGKCSEL